MMLQVRMSQGGSADHEKAVSMAHVKAVRQCASGCWAFATSTLINPLSPAGWDGEPGKPDRWTRQPAEGSRLTSASWELRLVVRTLLSWPDPARQLLTLGLSRIQNLNRSPAGAP